MSCAKCNNSTCTCPPSMEVTYSGIAKTLKNYKLESPIPDEVKDVTKLQNWFRKNDMQNVRGRKRKRGTERARKCL